MKNKKGLAFIPLLIIFAILIVVLVILIKNPQICFPFGSTNCFRFVPLALSKGFMFWIIFISFFLLQAGIIYTYYIVFSRGIKYIKKFLFYLKERTIKIEQYFISLTH